MVPDVYMTRKATRTDKDKFYVNGIDASGKTKTMINRSENFLALSASASMRSMLKASPKGMLKLP